MSQLQIMYPYKECTIPFTSHYLLLDSFQTYKSKVQNFVMDIEGKNKFDSIPKSFV